MRLREGQIVNRVFFFLSVRLVVSAVKVFTRPGIRGPDEKNLNLKSNYNWYIIIVLPTKAYFLLECCCVFVLILF